MIEYFLRRLEKNRSAMQQHILVYILHIVYALITAESA